MHKKGFTLIELLAVIVILAAIALIATPIILGIINDTKKKAFEDSAYGISQAAKNAYVSIMYAGEEPIDITYTYTNGVESSNPSGYTLNYEGNKPKNGEVILTKEGKVSLVLHDGKYCVTKSLTEAEVKIEEKTLEECGLSEAQIVDASGANAPVLTNGLIPVTWNGTNWVKASNFDDPNTQNWYDYEDKKWANAVTIDHSIAIDESSNNYTGAVIGAIQQDDGLYFNGTSDYIKIDGLKSYNFTNQVTFAVRFKPSVLNKEHYLIGNWQGGGGGLVLHSNNRIYLELYIGGSYATVYSTTVPVVDTFYTIVGTYDGANLKLYVNGVLEGTTPATGNVSTVSVPVAVGANPETTGIVNPCNGVISDATIYTRPISETEVEDGFTNEFDVPEGNLLLSYKFRPVSTISEGTIISMNRINTMWVWIPRYAYSISSGYHTNTTGTIDAVFLNGTTNTPTNGESITLEATPTYSGSIQTNYIKHPAFWWDNDSDGVQDTGEELTGIWVAKFEATAAEGVNTLSGTCSGDNVTTKTVKSVPNSRSWRCINSGNAFTVSKNMESKAIYGWGTTGTGIDTHLIKNIEWGATTYLSKSKYGKETEEVWINPADNYTTGCAGTDVSSAATTGCTNAYSTGNGVNASTTGNIYGIYDMNGGNWEFVSSYLNNGDATLGTNASSIVSATLKYKDLYSIGVSDTSENNYNQSSNKKGEAMYETGNNYYADGGAWFGDFVYMPMTVYPLILRGGYYNRNVTSGLYAFARTGGDININNGFRPVLLVGTGL